MNTEQLLQHFERISEAPGAITSLRRFILDLAVRGKMVPQDPSDEPAAELLKQIAAEKAWLVKTGEIRKPKSLAPISQLPFDPPPGWIWLPLGETGLIQSGNSINAESRSRLEKTELGYPFIATKDVGYGPDPIIYDNGLKVPLGDLSFKHARAESILICAEGGSAGRKIGMTDRDICFGNKLIANEPWSAVVPRLVMYVYMSGFFYEQFVKQMTGVIGGISIQKFLRLPFPLPPLEEQHRIVGKVDELMSLCDQLEAAKTEREQGRDSLVAASLQGLNQPAVEEETFREHARFTLNNLPRITTRAAHIKHLRQIILNLAVRGKLVPQDPSDEPATELLKRIAAEKARAGGRKKVLLPIEESEKSHILPKGWAWVRMGDAFSIRTGFAFKSSTYTDTGTLVFRVTNFDRDGSFDLADSVYYPTDRIDTRMSGFLLQPGEIIMVMVGGTIGKTTIVDSSIIPALLNQNMWRIRSYGGLLLSRYEYFLIKNINQSIHGITQSTHGHFAMSDYEKRVFPLPPPSASSTASSRRWMS